jgi:hypothetical protein
VIRDSSVMPLTVESVRRSFKATRPGVAPARWG